MDPTAALHEHFGFRSFRPGQEEAVRAALAGRDALVVMPTGSGKSLCYQLPALMRDDLTVVVSPLVALMQDQVEALHARGAGDRVALVNAQQDGGANRDVIDRAAAGELRLLYVAPERFGSPGFLDRIAQVRVGLFVVDEAHCVSQWGHDFRPDYFRLEAVARRLGAGCVMASTATATARVGADIVRRLALRDPVRVATGFDRPNLSFVVARPTAGEKRAMLLEALRAVRDGHPGRALLLAEARDKALHVHFIRQEQLDDRTARDVAARLEWAADGDGGYAEDAGQLSAAAGCDGERLRAVLGHLTRAGVIEPAPAPSGRVAGRLVSGYDRAAAVRCRASMEEGI